jgi:hypothetical protein
MAMISMFRVYIKKTFENIKILAQESLGYSESKHCKPWIDEECSKLADQRKQAKL